MKQKKLDTIKTSGFKTPKDYFSQVEEQILNEVKLIDKIDQSGFDVPESYFDSIEKDILNKISSENDSKVVSLVSWKKIMYTAAIAASLILMFNVFFNNGENVTWENLDTASIENYIEVEEYSTYELASLLTEDELNKDNFIENDISENSIETYLLDNVELEDLIIE
ncbi:hypothetical protein [Psychroserpens luteolus]|uniref:hypothetical protein n=1 Tax=Psychroserpens luteolus TaxID=2855840 RepID=UPI001E3AE35B|nr:hypothetical protein [Psychroserpens luteolus]MCD2259919.1 hypothetical protein [Psychroserpens luteolus]